MRQLGLIVGVLVLIGALVMLNNGIGKNAPPDPGDDAPPQTQSQTQKPSPSAAPPASKATVPASEEAEGNPATAKYQITVGWAYDAANQAHPAALAQALDAVRQFAQNHPRAVSVEMADVDVPLEQRSPAARTVAGQGVYVNGKPLPGLTDNPGEGQATPAHISEALEKATAKP